MLSRFCRIDTPRYLRLTMAKQRVESVYFYIVNAYSIISVSQYYCIIDKTLVIDVFNYLRLAEINC